MKNIQTGTTLIIVGFLLIIAFVSTSLTYLVVIGIIVELMGVGLIIRQRIIDNERQKLITPIVTLFLLIVMVTYYLLNIAP